MNPAVARKLIESFNDAFSVQLFVQTELVETSDELDVLPTELLFNLYRQWPPRIRMSEAKFIQFLKVTCKLDVVDGDDREELPTVIVGVQLRSKAKPTVKAKARYKTKPPPSLAALQRAAKLPTFGEQAKHLMLSTRALRRLCRRVPEIGALFQSNPKS